MNLLPAKWIATTAERHALLLLHRQCDLRFELVDAILAIFLADRSREALTSVVGDPNRITQSLIETPRLHWGLVPYRRTRPYFLDEPLFSDTSIALLRDCPEPEIGAIVDEMLSIDGQLRRNVGVD